MKIVFVWTGVTGYMADCWRALAQVSGVSVRILIEERQGLLTCYDAERVLHNLDYRIIYREQPLDKRAIRDWITVFAPDVIAVVGWRAPVCRFVAFDRVFAKTRKWLLFDMPFRITPKTVIAPIVLRFFIMRFERVLVPGVSAARYARFLGFRADRISRGMFGIDVQRYSEAGGRVDGNNRPHRFLYVGRVAPEKRLDVLAAAYRRYSEQAANPWPMDCFGTGPCEHFLRGIAGLSIHPFIQPEKIADLYAKHGALVLASAFDPWPLVLAEAVASGLPVICTEKCGNRHELLRDNGLICPVGGGEAMAAAMLRIDREAADWFERGRDGIALVRPYSCENWAHHIHAMMQGDFSGPFH